MWFSVYFFLDSVSHSWGVPTMKISDRSILYKWENVKNFKQMFIFHKDNQ